MTDKCPECGAECEWEYEWVWEGDWKECLYYHSSLDSDPDHCISMSHMNDGWEWDDSDWVEIDDDPQPLTEAQIRWLGENLAQIPLLDYGLCGWICNLKMWNARLSP